MLPLKITNNTFIMHHLNPQQQTLFSTVSLWGVQKHNVHSLLVTSKCCGTYSYYHRESCISTFNPYPANVEKINS
jgi:hypothetical protein